jgi:hypothetical protein
MNTATDTYAQYLIGLMAGTLAPSTIVGAGFRNPRSVASAWLRKQWHNENNPGWKIDHVSVASDGSSYKSVSTAKNSKTYKSLVDGSFSTICNSVVTKYGVLPAPGDNGYMIFVCYA